MAYLPVGLWAQEDNWLKTKLRMLECLQAIEEHNEFSQIKSTEDLYKLKMGLKDSALIVNEVLASNRVDILVNMEQYRQDMLEYRYKKTFNVNYFWPYFIEPVTETLGSSIPKQFRVKALKVVEHRSSEDGVIFRDTLNLQYTMIYQENHGSFITGKIELLEPVGKYWLLKLANTDLLENQYFGDSLLVNGKKVKFGDRGYIIVPRIKISKFFKIESHSEAFLGGIETVVQPQELGDYGSRHGQITQLNFRPRMFYLALETSVGSFNDKFLVATNEWDQETRGAVDISSYGLEAGIDFWRTTPVYLSVWLSGGFQQMRGLYSLNDYRKSQPDTFKQASTGYTRTTILSDISEKTNWSGYYYKAGLSFRYQFVKWLGAELRGSYGRFHSISSSLETSASANYTGTIEIKNFDQTIYLREESLRLEGDDLIASNELSDLYFQNMQLSFQLIGRISKRWHGYAAFNYNQWSTSFSPIEKEELSYDKNDLAGLHQFRADNTNWDFLTYSLGIKYYL